MYPNNNNDQWASGFDQPASAPYPPIAGSGGAPPPQYAPAPAPAQQPVIINVQQNAPAQQAPPSYGGAPPVPVVAKTSDQIFGTNTGGGFVGGGTQRSKKQDSAGFICFLVIFIIIVVSAAIHGLTTDYHDICHAPNPFTLEPGITLVLSPPTHPTCTTTDNDGNSQPDCYVYSDNKNCPLTIQSQDNQITYQLRSLDLDYYNCGDYLTIHGDQRLCESVWSAESEVRTMEYEIDVHWFTDWIPNNDYEGFTLWVWEENPNDSRSIAPESTITKALDPKVRPSKEERDEIRKANLNPPGEFVRY